MRRGLRGARSRRSTPGSTSSPTGAPRGGPLGAGAATAQGLVAALGRRPRAAARRRWRRCFPLGIAGINLAGLGPVSHRSGSDELRRAGIAAMGEVVRLLGVERRHVVFGHTHRAGPAGLRRSRASGASPTARELHQHGLLDARAARQLARPRSPYRPGTAYCVEDEGPPRLVRITGTSARARAHVLTAARPGPA